MAGPYKLKNGSTIAKVTITPPKELNKGSVTFVPPDSSPDTRMPVVLFSTAQTVDENGKATTAAYQVSATVTPSGFTKSQIDDNDVRFVQFCEISKWRAAYAGKKNADGMIEMTARGSLTGTRFLDCLTNSSATQAVNFPYYNNEQTVRTGTAYFPMMQDTPGARLEGDMYNGKASRNNYLWTFESEADFISFLVFVHKDGSREPLEGWAWSLKRKLVLRWHDGKPQVVTQTSDLRSAASSTKLENDIRRAIMIKPDGVRVVNIEFNKAIMSYRSHTDIFFFERYDYDPAETPPSDFWT